ncbi:multiple monosaccharide ABC transporter permease [Lacrimispora saccharolytica]|uniref:multiple monosaccharide ABC transporter permease n=1 Tax=Lacrimispora saccharolytica TaxID=84030 RepID=UPI00265D23F2|nr:multiple monosaccharide ABC transporter permease [Lacrimispora saccharolytica]MCF2657164.1 sugar ABC transporter permease [Lacrimispora saccharolytica]MCI7557174.1 sugar ABC transporter permease [Lachnospiraceae bacterium]MDD7548060.1 sugar ABC transporter permease [Lachnospiraceae bacterium]MDY4126621.1 multiple monosaccharide ABC transporter permease [Lachnospiraceae bacterium]
MNSIKITDVLKKYTMVIALVLVVAFFYISTDGKILYAQNINNLISQNAYVFVLAAGMLLCILTGGNIDLAVGSVVCFVGGIGAVMMDKDINVWVAVAVMLVGGLLVGLWQGFWIAYVKVPPFIATLAGMYAFRGLSNVVLQGFTVGIRNTTFLNVFGGGADCYIPDFLSGSTINMTCLVAGIAVVIIIAAVSMKNRISAKSKGYDVAPLYSELIKLVVIGAAIIWVTYKLASYKGIPTSLLWIVAVLLIYAYITTKTTMGRYLYAVGGNEKATKLSGIDPRKVYLFAYVNMGLMAGLAGILTVARATQAQPTFGQGYEMDAIAACFIGGASAYGGEGGVFGVVIGAVLMGVINQGMSIMGMEANYQKVVKGVVLLVAIIFDVLSNKKKK